MCTEIHQQLHIQTCVAMYPNKKVDVFLLDVIIPKTNVHTQEPETAHADTFVHLPKNGEVWGYSNRSIYINIWNVIITSNLT